MLSQKLIGSADVGEGVGPGSAFVANTAIFDICRGDTLCGEGGTEVAGVVQIVFGSPESAMDVHYKWMWGLGLGQAQV